MATRGSAKGAGRGAARGTKPAGPGWRGRVRGALPFAIAAAAGFVVAYLVVYLFVFPSRLVPDEGPVPDVRGQLTEDAQRTLRDAGFGSRTGQQRVNASLPAGTVAGQAPAPGTVRPRGAVVTLDVVVAP